jgi:hypothetical protein
VCEFLHGVQNGADDAAAAVGDSAGAALAGFVHATPQHFEVLDIGHAAHDAKPARNNHPGVT